MTKRDIWYLIGKYKKRIILLVTIASSLGFGISQSEAIASKLDDYALKYINSRVDARIDCMTKEVYDLKRDVKELTKSSEKNNSLLEKLIITITSKT